MPAPQKHVRFLEVLKKDFKEKVSNFFLAFLFMEDVIMRMESFWLSLELLKFLLMNHQKQLHCFCLFIYSAP
jgi:hypothetical protein